MSRQPRLDGGLRITPRVARVLLRYREDVAQATERAVRELESLGVDPGDFLRDRRRTRR